MTKTLMAASLVLKIFSFVFEHENKYYGGTRSSRPMSETICIEPSSASGDASYTIGFCVGVFAPALPFAPSVLERG